MCVSVLCVHISLHIKALTGSFCKLKVFTSQYYNTLLAEEDSDVKTCLHSCRSNVWL